MAHCAVLFFQYVQSSTVSVGIGIPSSASTPQVGFMSMPTSSTPEERLKFQDRQRGQMEVQ